MKFLIPLLATAALVSATFSGGKYIDIKQDGTMLIKGEDGKQIYITKQYGPYGQKNIEIEVTGPNNFAKMYQFEYNNKLNTFNKNYQDQYDIIDVILREYLGHVDEFTYQQLLNKVQSAVFNGYLDGQILYLFQALCEDTKWDSLVSGQNVYGQVGGLLNTQQNKYGLGFFGKLFKGQGVYGQDYNQYNVDYYFNVLMKIFDRQVLKAILIQQQMNNQMMFGQYSNEKLWDMVFSNQGIFDSQYLVQIINNKVLRNYFIQQGLFDSGVLDQILVAYKTEGVYNQILLQRLFKTQVLKYFFVNRGISVYDIMRQTTNNSLYNKGAYGSNILMKIFDRQVLKTILIQQQMNNQVMFGQYSNEKMWDIVFSTQGIFDGQYLIQIINNKALRNYFVQQGLFDNDLLDQILVGYKTEGVYNQSLLQRLVKTQVLKYLFINQGISVYNIIGQTSHNTLYNQGVYGSNVLERIISQPTWRNVLVQYGIFNKNILNQILYRYNTQGIYDQVLLRQLVNKETLYNVLAQYGIVDQTILRQYVDNEYLGLNFLYGKNFFQQTPRITYQQFFGTNGDVSEYVNRMPTFGGNFWKNMLNGQQYYGWNQGPFSYGKYYNQYPVNQQVY